MRRAGQTAPTTRRTDCKLAVAATHELVEPGRQPLELTRERLELRRRLTSCTSGMGSGYCLQLRPRLLVQRGQLIEPRRQPVEPRAKLAVALTHELVEPRRQPLQLTPDLLELSPGLTTANRLGRRGRLQPRHRLLMQCGELIEA